MLPFNILSSPRHTLFHTFFPFIDAMQCLLWWGPLGGLPFFALPLPSTQIGSLSKQILSSETKKIHTVPNRVTCNFGIFCSRYFYRDILTCHTGYIIVYQSGHLTYYLYGTKHDMKCNANLHLRLIVTTVQHDEM